MIRYFCALLISILLLTGCEGGESTPFPVEMPVTPTTAPLPTEPPPVRYALAVNTRGFIAEYALLGHLEQLTEAINPADLGARYDIVAAYGSQAGWTRSPITPQVMVVINPNGVTLTPQLAGIVRQAINPQSILGMLNIPGAVITGEIIAAPPGTIRTELANLGIPDGLQLALGYAYTPGATEIAAQLAEANINTRLVKLTNNEIRTAFAEGRIQLALITWTTLEQQQQWRDLFGAEYTLDLYNLPISYQALPELTVTFTPGGWPLAGR